jgi:hypothetical protein
VLQSFPENGVERLILGARWYVMPTGQIGQELFQPFVTGLRDFALINPTGSRIN